MIRTFAQLCAHAGAGENTEKSLSRRVENSTRHGAWAALVAPGRSKTGRKEVSVTVLGMPSLNGWTVHALRVDGRMLFDIGKRLGRSEGGTLQVDREIPEEVLTYLCAKPETVLFGRKVYTCDKDSTEIIRETLHEKGGKAQDFTVSRFRCWERIQFKVWVDRYRKHRGGVQLGSIVEGVDNTTEIRELLFPFTEEAWDQAVKAVDDEAETLWQETHGCPACGIEGEFGGTAINPDCEACKGEGVIL